MKIYYLAHPYSAPTPEDEATNYESATRITAELMARGHYIFSPLTHSHPIHLVKPQPADFWYTFDFGILERCDAIIMCPGWKNSSGCRKELEFAKDHDIRVLNYCPDCHVLLDGEEPTPCYYEIDAEEGSWDCIHRCNVRNPDETCYEPINAEDKSAEAEASKEFVENYSDKVKVVIGPNNRQVWNLTWEGVGGLLIGCDLNFGED